MDVDRLERMISEAHGLCQRILDEARGLLRGLDTATPAHMAETLQIRQDLIDRLHAIERQFDRDSSDGYEALAKFRSSLEGTIRGILEIDGLFIGLAQEKQAYLKGRLASVKKSKVVSQAYQTRAAVQRPWVNDSM